MGIGLGGINSNYNMLVQGVGAKNSGQGATPTWATNKTHASVNDMSKAFSKYGQEWKSVYAESFAKAGAEGNGKITQDELNELLQQEFGGMGVNFTDHRVDIENPKAGTYEVYIDQVNRQKMADDPEYRAQVMSVIQIEMAGSKGYSVKGIGGNVINDRTTGLSMNMAEGDPIYEGVPHTAGGTSATGGVSSFTMSSGDTKKNKSVLEQLMEKREKQLEEEKEQEKRDAAKAARQDMLELSIEASAKAKQRSEELADAEKNPADESDASGGQLNVMA